MDAAGSTSQGLFDEICEMMKSGGGSLVGNWPNSNAYQLIQIILQQECAHHVSDREDMLGVAKS